MHALATMALPVGGWASLNQSACAPAVLMLFLLLVVCVLLGWFLVTIRDEITRQPSLRATRWVLQYRPGDGQLQKARLETYVQLQQ